MLAITLGLNLVVLGALVAWSLSSLHDEGRWPFSQTTTPDHLEYGGRSYERGGPADSVEEGLVEVGRSTAGVIYGEPGSETRTSTVIQVADGDEVYWYGLVGGP